MNHDKMKNMFADLDFGFKGGTYNKSRDKRMFQKLSKCV